MTVDIKNLDNDAAIFWFDDFSDPGKETNHHRFLSNFYVGDEPINLDGHEFMTGEHAFQAAKAVTTQSFLDVKNSRSPGHAKMIGKTMKLRSDWESVKYDVMAAVLRSKFRLDREEGRKLLDTGDALLVEGTYWGDTVWGIDLRSALQPGRNWLGTLLMARRAELRAEERYGVSLPTGDYNIKFVGLEP